MRQIKLMGEGIGMVLKKKITVDTLGEIQKEDGTMVSRMDIILECIAENRISEAVALVNTLKYKMSAYEFQGVSQWLLELLKEYQNQQPELLTDNEIDRYRVILNDLI